jgi:hypothetical protein
MVENQKRKVCGIIAEYIISYNVKNKRDWKQVFNKIQHLERTFWDAYIFANKETGVGMLSSDTGTFNDIVTGKCKHYYDLEAVFGDRSGNVPKAMSYEVYESDYESDDNDDNTKKMAYKSDKISEGELENDNDDEEEIGNKNDNVNNGNDNDNDEDYVDNDNDATNESDHEIMVTPQVNTKQSKQTPVTTITKPNKKKWRLMPKADDSLSSLMAERKKLVNIHIKKQN